MRRHTPSLGFVLIALSAMLTLTASRAIAQSTVAISEQWNARLLALDPARPADYFNLAEEISDAFPAQATGVAGSTATNAAQNEAQRELARQLFALAGALNTPIFGRSAMLAISELAISTQSRERALAAAEIVGGRGEKKSVFRPEGAAAMRVECKSMRANTRVSLDPQHERTLMLIELALRRGELRGLGLDIVVHGDRPLIEIDRDDIASLWQIDPKRVWWRDGAWSAKQ